MQPENDHGRLFKEVALMIKQANAQEALISLARALRECQLNA